MKYALMVFGLAVVSSVAVWGGPEGQEAGIKKTALDYGEGWYEGDAARMERALHPDLAKRVLMPDARRPGKGRVEHMSAMTLVQYTRNGLGKETPSEQRKAEVKILDIYGNTASVKLEMHDWIDYMHMVRVGGEWKIVNVLWEFTPEAKKRQNMPEEL